MSTHEPTHLSSQRFPFARLVAAGLAMLGAIDAAKAATITSVGNGRWQDVSTWDNGVPAAGDDVIISWGDTVTLQAATSEVNSVTIRDSILWSSNGELQLKSGAVLKVRGSIDVKDSLIFCGRIDGTDATGATPIIRACNNGTPVTVTLDGPFDLSTGPIGITFDSEGRGDGFRLLPGGTIKSISTVTIAAPFENDGLVWAESGDLKFTCTIGAGSSGLFKATWGTMVFDLTCAACITSGADFRVGAGVMRFKADVSTNGGYKQTGGAAVVEAGVTFSATGPY